MGSVILGSTSSHLSIPKLILMPSYTHYWYAGPNTDAWLSSWPQLVADAQLIIDKAPVKVQRDEDDPRPPLVDKEAGIRFNGADWSHETFIMPKILNRFDFCKTLSKPYDVVVATILLRASVLGKDGIEVAYVLS